MNGPIRLRAAATQVVEILASGPGLDNVGPALLTADAMEHAGLPPDLESLLSLSSDAVAALPAPDVVQLFALAVSDGFFGSTSRIPASATCSTRYESASSTRVWILQLSNTPPSALRVLLALLDGLEANGLAVHTQDSATATEFDVENSTWPEPPETCPFAVELDDLEVLQESGTMHVRLEAARPLTAEEMAGVERCFEIWTSMLLLGGYMDRPLHGAPPVDLDPGGWEDERTWAQGFEVFRCVPHAMFAVLHFTSRLAERVPIRQLRIQSS
jgi:hypothetical protein